MISPQEQLRERLKGVSPTTGALSGAVVLLYLLRLAWPPLHALTVTPAAFGPKQCHHHNHQLDHRVTPPETRLWTLVTAGFIETHLSNVGSS